MPVTGVSLNKSSLSLTAGGETETLTATVAPANATNKNVTWKSSNTAIATVTNTGVVNPVAEGTATITVTTADGGKTATCAVTVIDDGFDDGDSDSDTGGGGGGCDAGTAGGFALAALVLPILRRRGKRAK